MSHIFVLMGKAGVGKTSIAKRVVEESYNLTYPLGTTTRKPRRDEKDGVDYRFISLKRFKEWDKQGRFIETTVYRNEHYGLLKQDILELMDKEFDVLTILTPDGLDVFKKRFGKKVTSIFITPPSEKRVKSEEDISETTGKPNPR
ncbi:guanylate kinase [Candidatus Liberibacter solanacearum CLso-ZC1]|uniref:Guanylate kinase n=1 Tax=Liberibacter solanacearum (strain CLso-ZC1) TaxID=658172 RepID=E4UC82_LIBSC|nr:guanylate kinase [Candidatus Liberibacter solanacearum]ADR51972.1 guanylate kinase [Candidatus Liberibacter solanacearum CLso-ZC1]ADR52940.1 guanylate kinase [Candidatus Liberibacter solanacearum CLso-ZC1]